MLRRFSVWVIWVGMTASLAAAEKPASLSGYVRDAEGVPQMGATVEVLSAAALEFKALTDERGFFRLTNLLPGVYSVKVSAPSFLPTLREHVGLHEGSAIVVNLTLNTLFQALQLGPPRTPSDDDDWKWTLRSVASRPVLRALPDGTVVVATGEGAGSHDVKATLALLAGSGSDGYGSESDMMTGFALEHPVSYDDVWTLAGNVGYGVSPAAILRTSFTHRYANGSDPTIALTVRNLAPPGVGFQTTGLQAIALTSTDSFAVGNVFELHFGSELQTVQFMGRVSTFRPFGTADLHLDPDTVVEYAYATSRPPMRSEEQGDESMVTHLGETGPRVSISSFSPALERANHQELSLSHRMGKTNVQFAVFSDRVANTVLTGVGDVSGGNGELLPDLYSGTFSYRGVDFNTSGLRFVLQHKLRSDLTATLDYGYGGVLDLARPDVQLGDARQSLKTAQRHAVSARLSGRLPRSKTKWSTSYGWTSGGALTPVDMFNASAGQSEPYLNIYVRQPLPTIGFLPVKMEAMIDLRNLLAQGYVPVMGTDGQTVYLVQSARAVRGGVAFTF
jgi:Carboxypeptidase regulatory-like domain